jgi:hypothetical protein
MAFRKIVSQWAKQLASENRHGSNPFLPLHLLLHLIEPEKGKKNGSSDQTARVQSFAEIATSMKCNTVKKGTRPKSYSQSSQVINRIK